MILIINMQLMMNLEQETEEIIYMQELIINILQDVLLLA